MAGSTMVAFKSTLLTALRARAGLTGVRVDYAPNLNIAPREHIYFGAIDVGDHEPPVMRAGRVKREENYTSHIFVVVVGRPTPVENETRALALTREIEEELADRPEVPGSDILFALVEGMSMSTVESTDGPYTTVDVSVRVRARLL